MSNQTDSLNTALAGRYRIEREIGAGGMATVYLAHDVKHDRRVALKVLKPELGAVLGVERFLAEIKVTANLQHPNLLPLFDSGEADGLLFYVMPFVEGETLRSRLEREKQLPVDEAIRIASAIAGALDYAHRCKVIHRDLKPENILVQEGQPLIADFGIALAVSNAGGARVTQTGLSLGTPQYMSPEQAAGERTVDGRADIYALGAVTYEMLVGDPPHVASTAQAVIAKVLAEKPGSVRTSRPNVPPYVDAAIGRALEKLAADRFTTAKEFVDALEGRGPLSAGRYAGPGGPRPRRRDPVVLALVALVGMSAAVAGWQWTIAHRRLPEPVIRFAFNLPDFISRGLPVGSSVAISQDGRVIAYLSGSASGSSQQVFVRSADDLIARPVPGTELTQVLCLSPDGKWLAFWSNGQLQKVAIDGGTPLPLGRGTLDAFRGASWSSRGVIVAAIDKRLVTIPDSGGQFRPVKATGTTPVEKLESYPLVLADGQTVLYAGTDATEIERRTISAVSLSSGKRTRLGVAGTYPLGVVDGFLVYATSTSRVMAVAFDEQRLHVTGTPFQVGSSTASSVDGAPAAALSASGTLVYQDGTRTSDVVLVDAHGGARTLLAESRSYGYPRFSPDGKRIAFSIENDSRRDVWLYDLQAQTLVKFTDDGLSERPEWTPEGKRVVYRTGVASGGASTIWSRPADMSTAPSMLVTNGNFRTLWEAVVTPDGRGLVLQRDDIGLGTGADVVYRSMSGDTATVVISATKADENEARVSPDGRWVAFRTDVSGTNQVVVQPLRGLGGQVVVSTTAGTEPVWSRDGRKLYYRDGKQLVEVAFTAPAEFKVTSRTPLFADQFLLAAAPHANYDVSPDGTGFLMLRPKEGRQLVYVHHWSAELRRQASTQAQK